MSKGAKVALTVVILFFAFLAVVGGLLFWWGRRKLGDFSVESITSFVGDYIGGEDFDISFDEEEGMRLSFEDEDEEITYSEPGEGKIIDDIYGISLPEVELSQLMEQRDVREGSFMIAYQMNTDSTVEEIKSDYVSQLEGEGWNLVNEGFMDDSHLLSFINAEESYLQVFIAESELTIIYEP